MAGEVRPIEEAPGSMGTVKDWHGRSELARRGVRGLAGSGEAGAVRCDGLGSHSIGTAKQGTARQAG